jgi:hypothetical protein
MEIILGLEDIDSFEAHGFSSAQVGLEGDSSETRVTEDPTAETATATVDEDGNIDVNLPFGAPLPITVTHEQIASTLDNDRARINDYFGNGGNVTVISRLSS